MPMWGGFLVRLRALLFRRGADAEVDEELRYHLQREIERNIANGMTPNDAHFAARRAFGNVTVAAEGARDAARWRLLEELGQDASYALRTFRRAPTFVATVVLTIGLGLGLLTTAFTLFDAYVLRPQAVRDPHSLYEASWRSRDGGWHRFTWAQYRALDSSRGPFTQVYAWANLQVRFRGRPMFGRLVSGNYFEMLGVPPALGRMLRPDESEVSDQSPVVVLSYDTWDATFGHDSTLIGRSIVINGVPLRVIGVARSGFTGLESFPMQFWVPITMAGRLDPSLDGRCRPSLDARCRTSAEFVGIVGRVAPGVTGNEATAALSTWMRTVTADGPRAQRARDVDLEPRGTSIPLNTQTIAAMAPIAIAFLLVMLIACANVANVMLARGMARQREIGIRLSIGAARHRLIRQLLTESVLLSVPSAILGYLVSRLTIRAGLVAMIATAPPAFRAYMRPLSLSPDARIAAFIAMAAVAAAIVFGLAPAIQSTRPSVVHAARGDFDSNLRPSRLRSGLVVVQIVVSVLLLICAGVLLGAARRTQHLSPGIRTANLVQVEMYDRGRSQAIATLSGAPFVRDVASGRSPPLDGTFWDVDVAGDSTAGSKSARAEQAKFNVISPAYFRALDIPLLQGRPFSTDEARARAAVAIVSQSAARRFWPNGDAIGHALTLAPASADRLGLRPYHVATVIGIVPDVAPGWIGVPSTVPVVYYPQPLDAPGATIVTRVRDDGETGRQAIDQLLTRNDSVAVAEIHTLESSLALQLLPFRVAYWVSSLIGGIALLLTLTGVYGVLSYIVEQRRREFGVRMALGAGPQVVTALVLRQLLRLAIVGSIVGAVLALGVSRLFAAALFFVDTFDVSGFVIGVAVVVGSCLFAAYIPSRRAAMVDPVEALRADS